MTRYQALMARIESGEQLLIDGATGTEIERRGVEMIKHAWNGGGAVSDPEIVQQVHEDYIAQGANVIITNTFATCKGVLLEVGMERDFEVLNRRSVELALAARAATDAPHVLVAGGISHWSYTGNYPSLTDLRAYKDEQVAIMVKAGIDLFMLEMMHNIGRMSTVLDAVQAADMPVWVGVSCELDENGAPRLLDGELLSDAVAVLIERNVPLLNIMHTEVDEVDACLDVIQSMWSKPVGVYAHSGQWVDPNWIFNGVISPEDYASAAQRWLNRGVNLVGGCCGVGSQHIHALSQLELAGK